MDQFVEALTPFAQLALLGLTVAYLAVAAFVIALIVASARSR